MKSLIFFPKFGQLIILSSDKNFFNNLQNFNNLHYVHLCNDFFTGIMESENH